MGIIRLLLAIAVVIEHSTPIFGITLTGGRTAVECFFVISGFYMAMVISTKYRLLTWREFMASRLFRLYPVYALVAVVTVLCAIGGIVVSTGGPPQDLAGIAALAPSARLAVTVSNVTMLGQDLITMVSFTSDGSVQLGWHPIEDASPGYQYLVIPQAWSISVELWFYMMAPWLARRSSRFLLGVIACSVTLRGLLILSGHHFDPWNYRLLPLELLYFVAGMLSYRATSMLRRIVPTSWWTVAGVIAVLATYQFVANEPVAIVAPLVLAPFIPAIFAVTRDLVWDRNVGELSYPLYMCHLTVIAIAVAAGFPRSGVVAVVTSLVAAAVIFMTFERPLDSFRQRTIRRRLDEVPSNK